MAPQIAWIGLGNMGRGMVKNIVEKGDFSRPLLLYNRTRQRADDLSKSLPEGSTRVVPTIEEAVSAASINFICVGDDTAVKETVATAMKSSDNIKSKLFVDCSTIHPETTNEIGETITKHGAHFVACPVFGAAAAAQAGQLVCVAAGPKAQVDKVLPYCEGVMGRAVINLSDQPYGKASLLKVAGNTFILNMVETLAEGHTLAEKTGLGTDNLHKFVEAVFPGPFVAYSNRLRSGDYYKRDEPLFAADLARKDAKHAMDLAKACGTRLQNIETADHHLKMTQEYRKEKGDITGIYGAVRQEAGLKFEN